MKISDPILVATSNPGKVNEIKKLLEERGSITELFSLQDLNIRAKCREKGKTFKENAISKANFYSQLAKNWLTIGEDSGLLVEALQGEPGIYSARFAGQQASDEQNITKLLRKLKSIKNRKARFVSVVALSKNGDFIRSFEGMVEGIILEKPKGSYGFGYDPVFFYPPFKKTFAEMTTAEKNKISHRSQAFLKLRQYLLKIPES